MAERPFAGRWIKSQIPKSGRKQQALLKNFSSTSISGGAERTQILVCMVITSLFVNVWKLSLIIHFRLEKGRFHCTWTTGAQRQGHRTPDVLGAKSHKTLYCNTWLYPKKQALCKNCVSLKTSLFVVVIYIIGNTKNLHNPQAKSKPFFVKKNLHLFHFAKFPFILILTFKCILFWFRVLRPKIGIIPN